MSLWEMNNKFLPALESARGLAALLVVCYHWHIAEFITKNSYLCVDLFFIISGYIIAKLYINKISSLSQFGEFIFLRLGRIWPLHIFYVCCFLTYDLFLNKSLDNPKLVSLLATASLLHSANNVTGWFNFPSWSVSAEWISYICFGLVSLLILAKIKDSSKIITTVLIIILSYLWCFFNSSELGLEHITQNAGWARGLGGFFAGVITYLIWPNGLITPWVKWLLLPCCGFIFFKEANVSADYYFLFIAVLMVSWLASESAQKTFLNHPILLWIGKLSYSIYLGHIFVSSAVDKLLKILDFNCGIGLVFLVKITFLLIISELTFRWIEAPCRSFVRNYINKKTA